MWREWAVSKWCIAEAMAFVRCSSGDGAAAAAEEEEEEGWWRGPRWDRARRV